MTIIESAYNVLWFLLFFSCPFVLMASLIAVGFLFVRAKGFYKIFPAILFFAIFVFANWFRGNGYAKFLMTKAGVL